jgi:hypothetical protein
MCNHIDAREGEKEQNGVKRDEATGRRASSSTTMAVKELIVF